MSPDHERRHAIQTILTTATPAQPAWTALGRWAASASTGLDRAIRQHRFRGELLDLARSSPRMVADLGMTVGEAEEQARAPFWQSPHLPPLRHF